MLPERNCIIKTKESFQKSALSLVLYFFQNRSSQLSLLNKKYFQIQGREKEKICKAERAMNESKQLKLAPQLAPQLARTPHYLFSIFLPASRVLAPSHLCVSSFPEALPPHLLPHNPPKCVPVGTANPHLFLYSGDLPLLPRTCSSSSSLRLAF